MVRDHGVLVELQVASQIMRECSRHPFSESKVEHLLTKITYCASPPASAFSSPTNRLGLYGGLKGSPRLTSAPGSAGSKCGVGSAGL